MSRHVEAHESLAAAPTKVFDRLDNQRRLGAHMGKPSIMMGGGHMTYDLDEGGGQAVGSHIRMGGSAFGLNLSVDEVVTERSPPWRKVWRTVAEPKLIVIGAYEMGFELAATPGGASLRVWIDYEPPTGGIGRLTPWLAAAYARWCVRQIANDAVDGFGRPSAL